MGKKQKFEVEIEQKHYLSADGKTKIHVCVWMPQGEASETPLAILQISHGMIDHIERFNELAMYMAKRGVIVVGNDHLGHGDSVGSQDDWGYFCDKDASSTVVEDLYKLTKIMKKKYEGVPYFLLGHSMGSFLARRYAIEYGSELDGLIILGTGNQPKPVVAGGLALSTLIGALKGKRYRSDLLSKIMFGSYNKRIEGIRTSNDWLTRDTRIVDQYNSDPKCTYKFTINGYKGLLKTILFVQNKNQIRKIPNDLPMLVASGLEDPVGNYGEDVKKMYYVYSEYMKDTELRLYDDCRHELHSELNRKDVFSDLYEWLEDVLEKEE